MIACSFFAITRDGKWLSEDDTGTSWLSELHPWPWMLSTSRAETLQRANTYGGDCVEFTARDLPADDLHVVEPMPIAAFVSECLEVARSVRFREIVASCPHCRSRILAPKVVHRSDIELVEDVVRRIERWGIRAKGGRGRMMADLLKELQVLYRRHSRPRLVVDNDNEDAP